MKPLYGPYDLVDRTGHFRKQAGAIAWNPNEDAGGKLSKYMDARLTRFLGDDRRPESIKSLPNLSPLETFDLHVFGSEGAPMNVKGTATTVLKEHHVESSERQAGLPTDTTMTDATDVNERSAESGPLAFPFCPYGEASNFGTRNGPSSAEDRLADFAWLDSTAKLNGQLLGYEPTDFSSHKFLYSRWNMIQRELYANWREDAVVDLSRRISELKRSGFGPFGQ